MRPALFLLVLLGCLSGACLAQQPPTKELTPRRASFKGTYTVAQALQALQDKTGNLVVDRRMTKAADKLLLNLEDATFWPALEAIARAAECGISLYQHDGKVALVDGQVRPLATSLHGLFRIRARRVALVRDDEAQTHTCTLTLEIAWEPRFEPLYLEVGPLRVAFADELGKVVQRGAFPGEGRTPVAGRNAIEVDIPLPAPPRSARSIASIEGGLRVLGPAKMLEFTFANLRTGDLPEQTQDGVKLAVKNVKTTATRWAFDLLIQNPPGNPGLESFQSWLLNNSIRLEKSAAGTTTVWKVEPGAEQVLLETPDQARISYSFYTRNVSQPGNLADWTLHYRTPGRIIEIPVPFRLEKVALP